VPPRKATGHGVLFQSFSSSLVLHLQATSADAATLCECCTSLSIHGNSERGDEPAAATQTMFIKPHIDSRTVRDNSGRGVESSLHEVHGYGVYIKSVLRDSNLEQF